MSPEPAEGPVLLDTSAWLLALGRSGPAIARERVRGLLASGRVCVTPIVCLELLGGTRSLEEFRRLRSRLEALPQFPIGAKEWEEAARLAFELRRGGKTVPYADILIATVAIQYQALLVHADRHYDLMAQSAPLAAENLLA